jgi:uncharacterized protein
MTDPQASPGARLANALRDRLRRRDGSPVEMVETHLSWILLARRLAIKLKKPIRLPFVDYGDIEARRRCCLEELRVNRRFAPGLYRAVLAVRGSVDSPRFGGVGDAIDHVVCMRRFPGDALLSERVDGGLDAAALSRFAGRLGAIHADAPAATPQRACASPDHAVRAVAGQLRAPQGNSGAAWVDRWTDEQAGALRDRWRARRVRGRVRECHGDLHLGNLVMLGGEIVAFDAIDFDPALRWIDVMSDVAFVAMDLEARGRRDLAFAFVDDYLQAGGDYDGVSVLRFYATYRALVRQLAASLAPPAPGPDYGAAAHRWATASAPRLVLMHGLSGSGKSTVARRLVQAAGAIRIRSDVERQRRADPAGAAYSAAATRRTYARLGRAVRPALAAGFPVIVDAAFLRADHRRHFETIARRLGVPFEILHCKVDDAVSPARLEARERAGIDPSEATVATWMDQKAWAQPLDAAEQAAATSVTGDAGQLAAIAARWRGEC